MLEWLQAMVCLLQLSTDCISCQVGGDMELGARCKVRLCEKENHIDSRGCTNDGYQTRKQKRENARKGLMQTRECVVPKDLLPPPGLPQGMHT